MRWPKGCTRYTIQQPAAGDRLAAECLRRFCVEEQGAPAGSILCTASDAGASAVPGELAAQERPRRRYVRSLQTCGGGL